MTEYAQSACCRMISLVRHFGDQNDSGEPCGACDFCCPDQTLAYDHQRVLTVSEQQLVVQILACLAESGYRAAGRIYEDLVRSNPTLKRQDLERLLQVLAKARWVEISQESFQKDSQVISYRKVRVTEVGRKASSAQIALLKITDLPMGEKTSKRRKQPEAKNWISKRQLKSGTSQASLVQAMKDWRLSQAKKKGIPAFRILSDRVLMALCEEMPQSESELLAVKGIGPKLTEQYGSAILKMIQAVI